jgi:predicted lipase
LLINYIFVYGSHSLGGAQALLAALDLYQRDKRIGPNNLSIFTVGAPRVGNPTFAYYVDSTDLPFSRSVNDRDSKFIYEYYCAPNKLIHEIM